MNYCVPTTTLRFCFSKTQSIACPMNTFISKGELQKDKNRDTWLTIPFLPEAFTDLHYILPCP